MRNLIGIIALSLLAATLGCASDRDPTNSTDGPTSDNPFQAIEDAITGLATSCALSADGATMDVTLAANEVAIISKRAVDSAIVVNGEICRLTTEATNLHTTTALASKVKSINVTAALASETVIIDYTNGLFATGSTTSGSGINLTLTNSPTVGVKGTALADTITAVSGAIRVNTDAVNDINITGTAGSPVIFLGPGNDTFAAGTADGASVWGSAITVYGGAGDDTFNQTALSTVAETIFGGDGNDTVSYAARTVAVTANLGTGGGIAAEADVFNLDLEVLTGGTVADALTGAAGVNSTLNGGAGDDTLTGGTGNDTLNGGDGNDTIAGAAGNDTLNGDAGNDTFLAATDTNSDVMNGGAGTDTASYAGRVAALTIVMDGVALDGEAAELDNVKLDVENCIGGSAADTITGNALNNVITGGMGADTLSGLAGDDVFLEGTADSDGDVFNGGDGIDLVDYSARTVGVTVTMGDDTTNDGETGASEGDNVRSDIENLYGSTAIANIITGNDLANEIVGGAGIDTIISGLGDDVIEPGGLVDVITCGAGFDILIGTGDTNAANDCEM